MTRLRRGSVLSLWRTALAALLGAVAVVVATGALAADPSPDRAGGTCRTPREAIFQLLYWLQPEREDAARAAACFEAPKLPTQVVARRAVQLKRVLDARNLYVRWEPIPDDPDYVDKASQQARYAPFPVKLPSVYVVRHGQRWVFPEEVVETIPRLYRATFPFDLVEWARTLPEWLRARLLGLQVWQLGVLLVLIVLSLLLQRVVVLLGTLYLRRLAGRMDVWWVRSIADSASRPLGGLAMALVLFLGIPLLGLPIKIHRIAMLAVDVLATVSVVWLAYRLIDVFTETLARRAARTESKLDDQLVPLVRKSLRLVVVILGVLFVLQNLDVDIGSLLAGLGIGGLAVALAAKDTLANFFGSVMIFVDKPFQVGDWIVVGSVEGTVEEVGFRSTRIRTFYNSLITMPNSQVATAAVDNMGARRYRRYKTKLSLTYDTPPEKITGLCEGLRCIIQALPSMRKDFDFVEFVEFGPSSLDVLLYCFMDTPDWAAELRTRHNLNLAILQLARELGVSFAYPSQSVYVEKMREPSPAPPPVVLESEELQRLPDDFGPGGRRFAALHMRPYPPGSEAAPRRGNSE